MKNALTPLAALAAALLLAPGESRAETRACTAITSLPAILDTPGVYCMTADLATNATTGSAITLAANDVVLDCNGYKLGGLGAGPTSEAVGIGTSHGLQVAMVRNCNVRGFRYGISLAGDGMVVADNRLDGNLLAGIHVSGTRAAILGNRVLDTGGIINAVGIKLVGNGEIRDNTVSGVLAAPGQASVGIELQGPGPMISAGNRVRGVSGDTPAPVAVNIVAVTHLAMDGDNIVGAGTGIGMACSEPVALLQTGVVLSGFTTMITGCGNQAD